MADRADEFLFENGHAPSRSKARALIEEGKVRVNGQVLDKPSRKIADGALVEIEGGALALKYVSRAGLKLEGFLNACNLDVAGAVALDAGASTGGFTDCILERGASAVFCVDVGTGQLHEKLLKDARAVNVEKTDVRALTAELFYELRPALFKDRQELPFDFICADLSFISLEKVFGVLFGLLKDGGKIVCLIKPQFEAGLGVAKRAHGVIKDAKLIEDIVRGVCLFIENNFPQARVLGVMPSCIRGGDGNEEYLIGLEKSRKA